MSDLNLFNLTIAFAWFASGMHALFRNRDPISPAKFYIATLPVYYGGLYGRTFETEVQAIVGGLVMAGFVITEIEHVALRREARTPTPPKGGPLRLRPRAGMWLWLVSIVPVLIQIYIIAQFGGPSGYMVALKSRVMEFRGLGVFFIIIRLFPWITAVYLMTTFVARPGMRGAGRKAFGLHLAFMLGMGFLTGSRSAIVMPLVYLVFVWHYCHRRVGLAVFLGIGVGAVVGVAFLGALREIYKVDAERTVDFSSRNSYFIWSGFEYGLKGIEVILRKGVQTTYYGTTYLTLFTNPVPRVLWPNKPDTGGVVFTKEYLDDEWHGLSNATPGLLGEAMMNFGIPVGLPLGFLGLLVINWLVCRVYARTVRVLSLPGWRTTGGFRLCRYVVMLSLGNGLLVGEFTNTTLAAMFPLLCIVGMQWLLTERAATARVPEVPWESLVARGNP